MEQNHCSYLDPPNSTSAILASLEKSFKFMATGTKEIDAVWRQEYILFKYLEKTEDNIFTMRHWLHHHSFLGQDRERKNELVMSISNVERSSLDFPNVDNITPPYDSGIHSEMFKEIVQKKNVNENAHISPLEREQAVIEEQSCKPRSTINHFLYGRSNTAERKDFSSAREMLAVQTLKKQINGDMVNSETLLPSNPQNPEKGFNFLATKKSLGSICRVSNFSRNSFVSPKRSNASENADVMCANIEMTPPLSHPALRNVDPKMVELINNEIIHEFRPVDWNEIAGLHYAKSIIKEAVVYPLLRPDIFTGLRRPPRGILLFGPPGTGKTLIGKCIASQSSSTFFSISSSSLTSKWMGDGEKMVRALFAVAAARQPSVIFIDEIDALLSQRSESENEGTRRLKTEFLVRLDGTSTSDDDRVLIIGATNRPQELDEAVRRRFVKRLYVPLPEADARAEILSNLLKTVENNLNLSQIEEISKLTEGYSGADMDSLCREASMEPLRSLSAETIISYNKENLRPINVNDFYIALKKIRPSVSQSDLTQFVEWNKTYGSSY